MKNKTLVRYNTIIISVSVLIPIVVAILFTIRIPNVTSLDMLPPIYATINGLTAVLLLVAVMQIKRGNRKAHERLMKINIFLSVLFLLMYIAYHITSDSTPYGGEGFIRYVYFFILITHILLSIALIPLVLFTYKHAALRDFKAHKRLAKVTFPIWFYVAVTGVVVYLMIAPYYG